MIVNRVARSLVQYGKPLILILSAISFIYLVMVAMKAGELKQNESRLSPVEQVELQKLAQLTWDPTTVQLYKEQLGIDDINPDDFSLSKECGRILTAFAVDDFEDLIWQYISLIATESVLRGRGIDIQAYLPEGSLYQLTSILKNVKMQSIKTLHPSCYDLSKSHILGSVDEIENDKNATAPYILETSARRFIDIVKYLQTLELKDFFDFRPNISDAAERTLLYTKISMVSNEFEKNPPLICIHVGLKRPSTGFYKRAVKVFKRFFKSSTFLILCPPEQMSACLDYFEEDDQIVIKQSEYQPIDLAILAMCNHTVVTNTFGALSGVINGGSAVVYDNQKSPMFNIPVYFAEGLSDWYPIA